MSMTPAKEPQYRLNLFDAMETWPFPLHPLRVLSTSRTWHVRWMEQLHINVTHCPLQCGDTGCSCKAMMITLDRPVWYCTNSLNNSTFVMASWTALLWECFFLKLWAALPRSWIYINIALGRRLLPLLAFIDVKFEHLQFCKNFTNSTHLCWKGVSSFCPLW